MSIPTFARCVVYTCSVIDVRDDVPAIINDLFLLTSYVLDLAEWRKVSRHRVEHPLVFSWQLGCHVLLHAPAGCWCHMHK